MFSGFKYRTEVAAVLGHLVAQRMIDQRKADRMADVASNRLNAQYGTMLLKSGGAKSAAAAVAAVMVRLSVIAKSSPGGPEAISAALWKAGAERAMQRAGATDSQIPEIIAHLEQMERNAGWDGPGLPSLTGR